jgi:hypothetical protein
MPSARLRNTRAQPFAPHKAVAKKGIGGKRLTSILNVFENAAVHAARPRAGGRGKDLQMYEKVQDCVGKLCSRSQCGGVSGERDSTGRGLIVRPSSKWPPGLATIE